MTNVQKCCLSLPFPDSSPFFSAVPRACLAEPHQELQFYQAEIKLSGNAALGERGRELQDRTPGHRTMKAWEGTASKLLPLQEVWNVSFYFFHILMLHWQLLKLKTSLTERLNERHGKIPKKRFISLYSHVIWVCVTQWQVFLDAIYSQWVLEASCIPYFLLFVQGCSIQHLHPCFLIASSVDLCKWVFLHCKMYTKGLLLITHIISYKSTLLL